MLNIKPFLVGVLSGVVLFSQFSEDPLVAKASGPAVGDLTVSLIPKPMEGLREIVTLSYSGSGLLNISGWGIRDENSIRYTFGTQFMEDGDIITLCSGNATGSVCDISITNSDIWNNTGDTLTLLNEKVEQEGFLNYTEVEVGEELSMIIPFDFSDESFVNELTLLFPADNEEISGSYNFVAEYIDKDKDIDEFLWEVRFGDCNEGEVVFGNTNGFSDEYTYIDSQFVAIYDVSNLEPGSYCLIIDPQEELWQTDLRVTGRFSVAEIIDENPEDDEVIEEEEENEENEENNNGRSGGSFINNVRPTPRVLGVTTSASNTCGMYLTEYLGEGFSNTPFEVMKLQLFLTSRGLFTMTTGIYNASTEAGVRVYQSWYPAEILQPWVEAGLATDLVPSGKVYKLTRAHINNSICPGSEAVEKLVLN